VQHESGWIEETNMSVSEFCIRSAVAGEELQTRAATFEASTFDAERRTVQVIFSSGAPVRRFDFEGHIWSGFR